MYREPATDEFGADWPRQKFLIFHMQTHVVNTVACIEWLQDPDISDEDAEKVLQGAWKQITAARAAGTELYELTCKKETEGTL